MRARRRLVAALLVTFGCAARPSSKPATPAVAEPLPAPSVAADEAPTLAPALVAFDALVAEIREHHEFSAEAFANLGRDFDEDVSELRQRMAAASSRAEQLRVFDGLQHGLLDLHLHFEAPGTDPRRVMLPVVLGVEGEPGAWSVLVRRVLDPDLRGHVHEGDVVLSIDGVETAELLREHRFASAFNQPRPHADDVAQYLARRPVAFWPQLDGTVADVELRDRAGTQPRQVQLKWSISDSGPPGLDVGLDPTPVCDGVPPRDYAPYRLTAVGARVCIYTATNAPYDRYPIVRHHGFLYEDRGGSGPRLARLDHALIAETLGKVRRLAGVVLDLRDNHGGNNPHVFLDWWAPAPYDNLDVVMRLDPELAARTDGTLERILWSSARAEAYRAAVAAGEQTLVYPFLCPEDDCASGRRLNPRHPVTRAPVALLVGPGCVSSCDTFSAVFARNGLGPLVGEPTAAAYTVNRTPIEVAAGSGEQWGTFQIATSRSRFGDDGRWIEAVPLPLDEAVPWTFDGRDDYERRMVDTAIAALRAR